MEPKEAARLLAFARIGAGASLIVLPGVVSRMLVGRGGTTPEAKVLARAIGGRDVALGIGLLAALGRDRPIRGWLEGGALADATDMTAGLLAGRRIPQAGRLFLVSVAASGAALGGWLIQADEGAGNS